MKIKRFFMSYADMEKWQSVRKRPMCWLAIGFLLIISVLLMGRSYQEVLYSQDLKEVLLEGKVVDKQYKQSRYSGYWQVTLKRVKVLRNEDKRRIEKLEGKYLCLISSDENLELKIGQVLLMKGTYTPWEEATNPGQFQTGKYYCSQGILGRFQKCTILKQGEYYGQIREGMWQLRQKAHDFLKQELGEEDGALISAMLLGEKSSLKQEDKNLYQRNGISHILAISGLHLMLLGMGVFRILKVILISDRQVSVAAIIIMSVYCIFTGSSISTIRATIMFALSLTARILGRSYDSLSALGLAAILQLFMNPYVLNYSGFLLSFLAVIGVTFVAPKLQELMGAKRKITKSICVSISASITTLPVLLCNYGTFPWYSVLLNLCILPAMSVLLFLSIMLIGISGTIGMGICFKMGTVVNVGPESGIIYVILLKVQEFLVLGIKVILQYFEICCKIFEYFPFQDGYIGAPSGIQIVIYGCLVIFVVTRGVKSSDFLRKMILLSAISILTIQIKTGAEITMLDVGQGDGMVIRNRNGNVYISDCGSSSLNQVGKYRLIPFLKHKGYENIKGIFLSHLDQDHMNGIVELLETAKEERIEISYLFLPESALWIEEDKDIVVALENLALQNDVKLVYMKQGDKIVDHKMSFLCVYPASAKNGGAYGQDRNNQSLVLAMNYKEFDMLLTGDIEKEGEEEIIEYIDQIGWDYGDDKGDQVEEHGFSKGKQMEELGFDKRKQVEESDFGKGDRQWEVLKVAHHGSSGSCGEEFLNRIRPRLSLISCGKNNAYGHPHEETLVRLKEVDSEVLSTVDYGAITIKIGNRVKVEKFKIRK